MKAAAALLIAIWATSALAAPPRSAGTRPWMQRRPLEKRSAVPTVGEAEEQKLWTLSHRAVQKGIRLLNFEAPQLHHLLGALGGGYEVTRAAAASAEAEWSSLPAAGVRSSYELQDLLSGRIEEETIEEHRQALGRTGVRQFAASAARDLKSMQVILMKSAGLPVPRGAERRRCDRAA